MTQISQKKNLYYEKNSQKKIYVTNIILKGDYLDSNCFNETSYKINSTTTKKKHLLMITVTIYYDRAEKIPYEQRR